MVWVKFNKILPLTLGSTNFTIRDGELGLQPHSCALPKSELSNSLNEFHLAPNVTCLQYSIRESSYNFHRFYKINLWAQLRAQTQT